MVKDLSKIKNKLEREKKEIEKELDELKRPPEFGPETYDDEFHETQELTNQLSIAQVLRSRLLAITSALRKIVGRNYGLCEKCGKKIEPELLELVPESRLCRECKKKVRG